MNAPSLFRPSELARFWELHPKTVYLWIREGRLPSVRTPGDQFRLRASDVRAFAEARGLPVPPFARDVVRRAYVVASGSSGAGGAARAMRKALRLARVEAVPFESPLDALLACVADPPTLLVLDAAPHATRAARGILLDDAARALRRVPAASGLPILVYNVATSAKAEALVHAGATRAVVRGKDAEIASAIAALFA